MEVAEAMVAELVEVLEVVMEAAMRRTGPSKRTNSWVRVLPFYDMPLNTVDQGSTVPCVCVWKERGECRHGLIGRGRRIRARGAG